MARIRSIKPDFFRHEGLFDLEQQSGLPIRVAFAGLWTVADREGRFRWKPRELKLDCLPHDDVDFGTVLDVLHAGGFIHRYSEDGAEFGCIPTWNQHQVINTREAASKIPAPSAGVMIDPDPSRNVPRATKRHVHAHDESMCRQCGSTEDLHIDHIVPFSKGGTHDQSNLQVLCRKCNLLKSDKDLSEPQETHVQNMCTHVHAQGEGEGKGREEERKSTAIAVSAPRSARDDSDLGPELSDEDEFWKLAGELSKRGIPRSRCGQLAKLYFGDFRAALITLREVARAEQPGAYLGKIIANLKREQAPNNPADENSGEPDFVRSARAEGVRVEKHPNGWRIAGYIHSPSGEVIGF